MKYIIFFAAAVAGMMVHPSPSGAWSYPGLMEMGDPVISVDARTLALGGSSIASAQGVSGVFYNPANLSLNNRRALVLGMRADYSSEALLSDRLYSSSILYSGPVAGVMLPVGRLRLAAGYRRELDLAYYHEQKVFSAGNPDTYKLDVSGGVGRTVLAAGMELVRGFHAGLSMNLLGSGIDLDEQLIVFETARLTLEADADYRGSFLQTGASYEFARGIAVAGISWSPSYKLKSKWSWELKEYEWDNGSWSETGSEEAEGEREIKMPSELGVGVQYNFPGYDQTMITADIRRTFWSEVRAEEKDKDASGYGEKINPHYRDTTRFSVGAEHYITFATALRLGFSFEPFYGDTAVDRVSFTGGVGAEVSENFTVDAGCTLGTRTYHGDNPFITSTEGTVSETSMIFMVSAGWLF